MEKSNYVLWSDSFNNADSVKTGHPLPVSIQNFNTVSTNNSTATALSASATYYPLFTIRNDYIHSHTGTTSRANQSVVNCLSIAGAHDDATPITFFLIRNATLLGTPSFSRYDTTSCIYYDQSATTCTITDNSQVQFAFTQGQSAGGAFAFSDRLLLQPGETLTLAARAVTGTATYVNASLNTREDQ